MNPSEHPDPSTNPFAAPESPTLPVHESLNGDKELAGRISRFIAQTLDNIIATAVIVIAMIPLGIFGVLSSIQDVGDAAAAFGGMAAIGAIILVSLAFGGLQIFLLSTRGQTLGKMILRIRIVKVSGEKAGFLEAVFLRLVVTSLLFGGVGIAAVFLLGDEMGIVGNMANMIDAVFIFRSDRRCVHDLIAGTKVVSA